MEFSRDIKKKFGRIGITLGQESHLRMPISNFSSLIENISPVEIVDFALEMHSFKKIKNLNHENNFLLTFN